MKKNIHPAYSKLQVRCSRCKKLNFETGSTLKQEIYHTEQCIHCHPWYTKSYKETQLLNQANRKQTGRQGFSLAGLAK